MGCGGACPRRAASRASRARTPGAHARGENPAQAPSFSTVPRTASSAACLGDRASVAPCLASVAARRDSASSRKPSAVGGAKTTGKPASRRRAHIAAPVAVAPTKAIGRRAGSAAPGSAAPGSDAPSSPSSSRVGSFARVPRARVLASRVFSSPRTNRGTAGLRALCARFPETDGRPSIKTREGLASTRRGIASARRADRETVSSSSVAIDRSSRSIRRERAETRLGDARAGLHRRRDEEETRLSSRGVVTGGSSRKARSFVSVAFVAFVVDAINKVV